MEQVPGAEPFQPGAHGALAGWKPFQRPLFTDPAQAALARVGVVDVGSNSVRLVIFGGAARSPSYFHNEKVLCGLGRDLEQTGRLHPEGRRRALAALTRFQTLAETMGVAPLTAVATAAVREATDGPDFRDEVERTTGVHLHVIDSATEARLSAEGVLLGWPDAQGLVCDMGGASLELAELAGGDVVRSAGAALGPLKLQGIASSPAALDRHIAQAIATLAETMGTGHRRLYLVGGSWRAFARIDMLRRAYPLSVLHEYRMTRADVAATLDYIATADLAAVSAATNTSMARLGLVPAAARVLGRLLHAFRPREVAVSAFGIREGLLWQQMPTELRNRDPLIEACRFAEEHDARFPGFGDMLFRFLRPAFPGLDQRQQRLMRAACLLHDISWRANPEYRHEVIFENVTRSNLGGLSHGERMFLGLALLHRYKSTRGIVQSTEQLALMQRQDVHAAEALGKAMRFGVMFTGADPHTAGTLRLHPRRKLLELRLTDRGRTLYEEVVAARLQGFAEALGVTASAH